MLFRSLFSYIHLITLSVSFFFRSLKLRNQNRVHSLGVKGKLIVPPGTTSDIFKGFVSSKFNPDGLQVQFHRNERGGVCCDWKSKRQFEGYPNILHGGIAISLLDELSAYAVFDAFDAYALSVSCKVRWLGKVHIGKIIHGKGRVRRRLGRLIEVDSVLMNYDGRELVTMTSVFIIPTKTQFRKFIDISILPEESHPYFGIDRF
ncbi:hypothetical protein [Teredinibacter sp. KSP-S5-2]|uniref:PaaI family thioesterase n=1 Tax=Teredinibacter sp. KSP-S5-2 TaxID=3034506 RepID=UPI0029350376|nr:hypothetical protein [Teredinibacter sp. KSP-S5-2]WNO11116.1 hypothetical protein P5V12_08020 [Teredinibacter sp. KSP-S5-2]